MTVQRTDRRSAPIAQQLHQMDIEDKTFGFHLIQPEFHSLDNGIPVHLFRNSIHSLIKFEIVFKAGSSYQQQLLVAANTNRMLREGTSRYSSVQIADLTEFYGASILLSCDRDRATVGIICAADFFESILPVLGSMIMQPAFQENELRNLLSRQKQEFLVNLEKTAFLANRAFSESLFGKNHAYGTRAELEDFDKLFPENLRCFFESSYHSGNCEIFVTCSHNYKILPRINQLLGQNPWGQKQDSLLIPDFNLQTTTGKHILKENTVQTSLRIGKIMPGPESVDFIPIKVFSTILGGYFGSRLMKNIREEKGFTYGIGANIISLEKESYFVINTDVRSDVTEIAVNEIFAEISKLIQEAVDPEELKLVKNYLLGSFLQSIDGPFSLAERFKEIRYFGLNSDYFESNLKQIQQCNTEQIQLIGKQYFSPESMIKIVVGPRNI